MFQASWLILLFPLLGFAFTGLLNRKLSGKVSGIVASIMVLASFVYSVILFFGLKSQPHSSVYVSLFQWLQVGKLTVSFDLLIDPLSLTLMLIITGVGFLIHVFSIGYMHHDERMQVFFSQLNLFVFSMLLLVMSANYLLLFAGWEGVGLCSYLLIGFWYKKKEYGNAARKAFIMNRIGDLGFILGLLAMFASFGSLNFSDVFSQTSQFSSGTTIITFITLMLFVGATGKSAQIPLFTWLPDAMAGPTPVSALIHAATMVTAGIYLVARSSSLYILAPLTLHVILIIGIATALIAAMIALFQNDIKKILAYSTVSQLGYMFIALGLGAFSSSLFHVTTHAFFKALLFLGAGSIIHALQGEQDIRKMGGIRKKMPLTFYSFLFGVFAISGLPPFSGFFSKDEILAEAYTHNIFVWILAVAGSVLTCFYMFRLLFLVFYGSYRGGESTHEKIHESAASMIIPLVVLAMLTIAGGFLNIPEMFGGNLSFSRYLAPSLHTLVPAANPAENSGITPVLVVLILIIFSIGMTWFIYIKKRVLPLEENANQNIIQKTVYQKFYVDELYHKFFVAPYEWISQTVIPAVEKNIIDSIVNGVGTFVTFFGRKVKLIQNGNISFYMFIMVIAMILMIGCLIWIH